MGKKGKKAGKTVGEAKAAATAAIL